ncbi:MAG: hypothetical protein CML17_02265 [Pusillimonas sp.]|jgi:hypothetical protein|nr:hypothetical protein [Pusillimonas sp.]|tara:strand:- start:342 stop:1787 length:1446 start_codon:yes stop_codon:yes gene_type:complete
MASGGFAGGLAQGLRSGWGIGNSIQDNYYRAQDRKEQRELEEQNKRIAEAISKGAMGQDQALPKVELDQVQAAPSADLNQSIGLAPVEQTAQPVEQVAQPAQTFPINDDPLVSQTANRQPAMTAEQAQVPQRQQATGQPANQMVNESARFDLPKIESSGRPVNDISRALSGISSGIEAAWKENRPDRALQLMIQREKLAQTSRDKAYSAAMNQFSLSGDPNVFVPLVNDWLNTGVKLDGITPAGETRNGVPMYMVEGKDLTNGKRFSQPFSLPKLQSYIQGVADPATQKALAAQQMEHAYKAQEELFKSNLKIREERAKPRTVGKDQRLVDGEGNIIAEGSALDSQNFYGMNESDAKRLIDSNKELSNQIFKLNGLDSNNFTGLEDDARAEVLQQTALAQLINANNPGASVESSGSIAQIAYEIQKGTKNILAGRDKNGNVVYFARGMNGNVLIPPTAVPDEYRAKHEGNNPADNAESVER